MPKFGKKSLAVLSELHPDLQLILTTAIAYVDFSLICGRRGQMAQHTAFLTGKSKLDWPYSKHNRVAPILSDAADFTPSPDTGKGADYLFLSGIFYGIALMLFAQGKIKRMIRCGCDWNNNARASDEKFLDCAHVELL